MSEDSEEVCLPVNDHIIFEVSFSFIFNEKFGGEAGR